MSRAAITAQIAVFLVAAASCHPPRSPTCMDEGSGDGGAKLDGGLGVHDAGADGGRCAQCPINLQCSEATGCDYSCSACAADAGCGSTQYCKDEGSLAAFCTRRLAPCAEAAAPLSVSIELRLSARCPELAWCTIRADFDSAIGNTAFRVTSEYLDGGTTTTSLSRLNNVDVTQLWTGASQSTCIGPAAFHDEVGCFTHGGTIRVEIWTDAGATSYEYVSRGSIQPPTEMEQAIDAVLHEMIGQGKDAGLLNW